MRLAHPRFGGLRKGAAIAAGLLTVALVTSACGSSSGSNATTPATTNAATSPATSAEGPSSSSAADTATSSGSSVSSESSASGSESSVATSSAAGSVTGSGTFTIAVTDDPGNLDPSMTVLGVTRSASRLAYDTLVYQKDDGTFISGLADSWKVTGNSVTFTLHKGVTCSDGSTLTATDVKANIDFISDPKNKSPLLGVLLAPGLTTTASDSAGTVTVKAAAPDAFLLNNFSNIFIICKAGLADHKTLAQKTDGTGPFVLTQAVANDHYTYALNPSYAWGPGGVPMSGPGIPAQVNFRIIPNQSTTANLMLSGEVNMSQVNGADEERLRRPHGAADSAVPG